MHVYMYMYITKRGFEADTLHARRTISRLSPRAERECFRVKRENPYSDDILGSPHDRISPRIAY